MEILSFLRLSRRRVVALAVVAGLAGAGAGAYAMSKPAQYQSNATVFVGQALPDTAGSFDIAPLAADFQAALFLDSVVLATSEETEVPRTEFTYTSARNGDGSTVSVLATGPTPQKAELVARTLSTEAMRFVTSRRVERAQALVATRQTELDTAQAAIKALDEAGGYGNPIQTFNEQQAQAASLKSQAEDPSTDLTAEQRAIFVAKATAIRQTLPDLATKRDAYQQASQTLLDATTNLNTAKQAQVAAQAVGRSATSVEAVATDPATPVSSTPAIIRAAGAGVLMAVLVAVGFMWLLDDRRRRHDEARAHALANPPEGPPELVEDYEPIEGDPHGFAEADAELAEGEYYDDYVETGDYPAGYDGEYDDEHGAHEGHEGYVDGDDYPDETPHDGDDAATGGPYAGTADSDREAQAIRDALSRSGGRR